MISVSESLAIAPRCMFNTAISLLRAMMQYYSRSVLLPFLIMIFMNKIDMHCRVRSEIKTGGYRFRRSKLADNIVPLNSLEGDLRYALTSFAVECSSEEMKTDGAKTKTHLLSKKSRCIQHVSGIAQRHAKSKYRRAVFTSDGRQEVESDTRTTRSTGVVVRHLQHSAIRIWQVGAKRKIRYLHFGVRAYPYLSMATNLDNNQKKMMANASV